MQPIKVESTEVKQKMDFKFQSFDNRVSTITPLIKSETRDSDAPRNSVLVGLTPVATLTKTEMSKPEESVQAVMRSSQQAKIPLKKRELKLAENYHSNHLIDSNSSSIIVSNPSVTQTKNTHGTEGKVSNPVGPPAGETLAQQQQVLVTASRQELTNGRAASLTLLHREGHNGVIGHVGVIRSSSEHYSALGAQQEERNRLCSDQQHSTTVEEEREVRRQTVLVRNKAAEEEPTALHPHIFMGAQMDSIKSESDLPEISEKTMDFLNVSSLHCSTEEPNKHTGEEEQLDRRKKTEVSSCQQKSDIQERSRERHSSAKEGSENTKNILGRSKAESNFTDPPLYPKHLDYQGGGDNAKTILGVKDTMLGSEESQDPPEEACSELQKEGIRLKIKIPPHRRNRVRGRGGKKQRDKESKHSVQEEGRPLRRSARISRYASDRA